MGRIKSLLGFFVVIAGIYLAIMLLPVYMASYQFEDAVNAAAKFALLNNRSEDQVRDEVMKKAKELEVPVRPEMIKVVRGDNAVEVSASYSVVVNLVGGKQVTLQFSPHSKEKGI